MSGVTTRASFLVMIVASTAAACSTSPMGAGAGAPTSLQPVDVDDASLRGKTVVMTERRDDGLWSVTYLARESWDGRHSNVVVTDWSGEQHYDLPVLHGVEVEQWAWTDDGDFELHNGGSVVTLVLPDAESDPLDVRLAGLRHRYAPSGGWAQASGSITASR